MTRESVVEKALVDAVKAAGGLQRKLQWIGRVGAPDRFVAIDGRVMLVELKAPGETARASQTNEHKHLREAGVEVHVIDNVDDARELIKAATIKVGDLVRHVDLGGLCTGVVKHAGVGCYDVEFDAPISKVLTVWTRNLRKQNRGPTTKGRI